MPPSRDGRIRTAGRRDGGTAMRMTRQYLVGELSRLLAELRIAAEDDPPSARAMAALRRTAELLPPAALGPVVRRAVAVGDEVCRRSLERGDAATFRSQAAALHHVHEFGVCSGLIED
ncbi:hypothetical protein ACFY12_30485 [Streptomyces sp. NPDC001339]|uniref:hypothetical protein n=1 Tax=Streptomyces sp. NPDC001339 TaxID=3364563 RepID=UPI003695E86B